ncbi:hypothetical protein [Acidithiobacillus thiooxidans]|uniref:hypothetical protein n=1 Tax=Acidithiobacillus thiooxidans TaxID=930 RepID=UPI003568BEAD
MFLENQSLALFQYHAALQSHGMVSDSIMASMAHSTIQNAMKKVCLDVLANA